MCCEVTSNRSDSCLEFIKQYNDAQKEKVDTLVMQLINGESGIMKGCHPPERFKTTKTICFEFTTKADQIKDSGTFIKDCIDENTQRGHFAFVQPPLVSPLFDINNPESILKVNLIYLETDKDT